mmetsp:Transcript_21448/g.64363  ORF Transcript_21448/g.64363 Transcript_21448/m.64363 type:complete len:99 (-) Transcript_21448:321-617(-)
MPPGAAAATAVTATELARGRVLAMYREFLREASRMPTNSRKVFVARKVRAELDQHRQLSDPEQLEFRVGLMELQLDNVRLQRSHLNELARQGNLKGPK